MINVGNNCNITNVFNKAFAALPVLGWIISLLFYVLLSVAALSSLMKANEEMRVIAVGDDDQNIYEFRGSNSHVATCAFFVKSSTTGPGRPLRAM